eukprot:3804081-Rhodomonas_salina.1
METTELLRNCSTRVADTDAVDGMSSATTSTRMGFPLSSMAITRSVVGAPTSLWNSPVRATVSSTFMAPALPMLTVLASRVEPVLPAVSERRAVSPRTTPATVCRRPLLSDNAVNGLHQ